MRRTALLLLLIILAGTAAAFPAEAAPPAAEKVTICHKPGTPAEQTITVALPALAAHAAHGDYPGECGSAPDEGTDPGNDTGPIDACTAINSGSFENLLFEGTEVVRVALDFTGYPGHVIWFHVCNAEGCALIMPRTSSRAHDEFSFPWWMGGLWQQGPITIGMDIRPEPATTAITCSQQTGP